MKKSFLFAGLAAALCLVGCNKEADFRVGNDDFTVILNNVDSRTVNDGLHTNWVENDQLNVFYAPAGSTSWSNNIKFTVTDVASNLATGSVGELTESAYDWYFLYPYSSYVVSPTGLKADGTPSGYMTVGSAANGSQQQAGYNSMAHLADSNVPVYGVVKGVAASEQPVVAMYQMTSVVKVNVKNQTEAPVHIMNVSLTAPVDIVGTYYLDITGAAPAFTPSGESYVSKTAVLNVSGHTDLAVGATATFYLAVKPFTVAAGSDLTVTVTGSNGEQALTKTLAADAVFSAGRIKELNVNYDKAATVSEFEWVKKALESITSEDVFVIVGNNGEDYAMSNDNGTSAAPAAVSVAVQDDKLMLEPAANIQWTLTKSGSNYVFSPNGAETHLYATNTNNGVRVGTNDNTAFTIDSGYLKNVATSRYVGIYNSADWRCYSSINSNIQGQTFSFYVKYATGTVTPDKIFAATLEGAEDGRNLTVAASAVSATLHIQADDDIAWTIDPSEGLTPDKFSGTGSETVTLSFAANTATAPKEYSLYVRTDAEGVGNDEIDLYITQAAYETITEAVYQQVTSVTSGKKYILAAVVEGSGKAFTPISGNYGYASATDVTIQDGKIGERLANLELTFTAVEGGYSIIQPDGRYVALNGTYNSFNVYTTAQNAYVWSVAANEGGTVDVKNVEKQKHIVFDTGHSTFAAYASLNENNIYPALYEYLGEDTPSGPVDPTLTVPSTLSVEVGKTAKINVTTNSDGAVTFTSANTAVATVAADGTVTGVAAGTADITVSAAATSNFNVASATVAVTVTEPQTGSHYGKVNTITSGKKYLIAGGNQPRVLVPPTGTSNVKPESAAVAIDAGKIVSNETTDAYAVTINKNGDDVSIVLPNGNYLVYSGNSTNLKGSATETDTWTVSEGVHGVFRLMAKSTATASTVRGLIYRAGNSQVFGGYSIANVSGEEYFDIDLYELGAEPTVASEVVLSSISVSGQKIVFTVGDSFTFGGVVTATYSDGSTKDVTDDAEFSMPDMTTAGTKSVTVTYAEGEEVKTFTYQISVVASQDPSGDKVIIIDGSQLSSSLTSTDTELSYGGVTVVFSDGAKYQTSTGENNFSEKAILIGKKDKYIYNKTAVPGKIVKFEIYANKGASAKVSVGINFSGSPITAYDADAANTFTATLSELDSVYDCTDKLPADAKYFWYQVTNANNSQVQFRITYE